jgi:lambda family phage portal protein
MGELAFADMEGHALQGHVVDGDIWALLPDEGAAQLIEAHRVRTPTNAGRRENPPVHGVILDSRRRRLEILVTREDVAPSSAVQRVGDVKRYPIRDRQGQRRVLQVYRADRVTQTRGVSYLAPIFDPIGMHDDIQFAKLVQQQVASCFAIFRMQEELSIESPEATGEITTETLSDGATRTIQGIAPGMEIIGKPGEKLQGFSPTIPNPEFFPHAMLILTFIAINIGIPVAVLLLDPSQTNFSGWRGAIDQARLGFRRLQRLIVRRFHRPMCVWKLRQWAAEDSILGAAAERLGMRFYRHNWHPPGWQYIEPLKDASADLLRVRNALTSQRRRCAERGMDWEDVAREIVEDNSRLIALAFRKAERLNQRFPGLNVTWREVACLPTPDGLTVSVSAGEEGQTAGQRSRQNESEDAHDAG